MSRLRFTLDLDRCTGCSACRLGCSIENQVDPGRPWRTVYTFNLENSPELGLHHLSLACNHCDNPTCLAGCPAVAYRRDEGTGAVVLDASRCLGCRYCSWICPYGAPRYNSESGVMTKCTFCVERLRQGREPACVVACPVEALGVEPRDETLPSSFRPAGLPEIGIGPALSVDETRKREAPPKMSIASETRGRELVTSDSMLARLTAEWSLLVFSLMALALVSLYSASQFTSLAISPFGFTAAGVTGMLISVLHLGNPRNLLRAGLNLRSSWVSREIVFFTVFFWGAATCLYLPEFPPLATQALAVIGVFSLVSMDMVYKVRGQQVRAVPHSAMASLTFALAMGVLIDSWSLTMGALMLKAILYAVRRAAAPGNRVSGARGMVVVYRTGIGVVLPIVVWGMTGQLTHTMAVIALLVGEIVDRAEFYAELRFLEPNLQIERDLRSAFQPILSSRRLETK